MLFRDDLIRDHSGPVWPDPACPHALSGLCEPFPPPRTLPQKVSHRTSFLGTHKYCCSLLHTSGVFSREMAGQELLFFWSLKAQLWGFFVLCSLVCLIPPGSRQRSGDLCEDKSVQSLETATHWVVGQVTFSCFRILLSPPPSPPFVKEGGCLPRTANT